MIFIKYKESQVKSAKFLRMKKLELSEMGPLQKSNFWGPVPPKTPREEVHNAIDLYSDA